MPSYEQPTLPIEITAEKNTPQDLQKMDQYWQGRKEVCLRGVDYADRQIGMIAIALAQQETLFHIPSHMERHAQVFANYGVTAESQAAGSTPIDTTLDPLAAHDRIDSRSNID